MTHQRESPLTRLRRQMASGEAAPLDTALTAAQAGAASQAYLWRDEAAVLRRGAELPGLFPDEAARPALYGVPVSLKDCFDLAGTVTSCGSRFYAENNPAAEAHSWVAERLLERGAIITGKTHLHQLAYGITGENADFGDGTQPRDRTLLTGGSSSGAAATVQEGSALAAIGTDTGGSVRVPAALCGLAGYRTSLGWIEEDICWRGGAHLAASFDTIGLLFRDLRDGPELANAVFDVPVVKARSRVRVGYVGAGFLTDCEPEVLAAFESWKAVLATDGATLEEFATDWWSDSFEILAGIQASEAAALCGLRYGGGFEHFEPAIAARLAWGAGISEGELLALRERLAGFRSRMALLLDRYDFLLLPCSPVSRLRVGEDQSGARLQILRYTSPMSLAGTPVVTLPGEAIGAGLGTGMQLVGGHRRDADLLAYAARVGTSI